MNYILVMTEGSDEKALIDVLLEKEMLIFDYQDLVYEQIYHKRKIDDELLMRIRALPYESKVIVYRVGDKLSDKLDTKNKDTQNKIIEVKKFCTLPELEMLFIINEGLLNEFEKYKSHLNPSEFYKSKNKKYKKQASFIREYFEKMDSKEIELLFQKYSKIRSRVHAKDQHKLLEMLK